MFCNIKYFLCLSITFISLNYRYVFPGPNQRVSIFLNAIQSTTKCISTAGVRSSLAFPYSPAPAVLYFLSFLGRAGQIWPWLHSSGVQGWCCPSALHQHSCPSRTQGSEQHPLLRLPWQDWAGGLQEKLCERKQEVGHQHWQPQCVKKDCLVNIPSVPRTIVWYSKILPVGTL